MDKSQWKGDELTIMEAYDFRCVLCGFQYAAAIHEEPPRSLNPMWKEEPWRRFPLCAAHHDTIQDMPRHEAEELILRHVDIYFPEAINHLKGELSLASNTRTYRTSHL
jgi:hypothetical protein